MHAVFHPPPNRGTRLLMRAVAYVQQAFRHLVSTRLEGSPKIQDAAGRHLRARRSWSEGWLQQPLRAALRLASQQNPQAPPGFRALDKERLLTDQRDIPWLQRMVQCTEATHKQPVQIPTKGRKDTESACRLVKYRDSGSGQHCSDDQLVRAKTLSSSF